MNRKRGDVGLFDFFGKNAGDGGLKKHAARVADKRAQAPDRWDSLQALGAMRSSGSVEAMLGRFSFYSDPSITDQEEKEEACRLIVAAGDAAVAPVCDVLRKWDSIGWPLKLLERLVPEERVVMELLGVLALLDTEYERDPTRKIQVLQALEERTHSEIAAGVLRFLGDVSESARYHATGALARQADAAEHRDALLAALTREESVRVQGRLLELFQERGWDLGGERTKLERTLPLGFALDKAGVPVRRS